MYSMTVSLDPQFGLGESPPPQKTLNGKKRKKKSNRGEIALPGVYIYYRLLNDYI